MPKFPIDIWGMGNDDAEITPLSMHMESVFLSAGWDTRLKFLTPIKGFRGISIQTPATGSLTESEEMDNSANALISLFNKMGLNTLVGSPLEKADHFPGENERGEKAIRIVIAAP